MPATTTSSRRWSRAPRRTASNDSDRLSGGRCPTGPPFARWRGRVRHPGGRAALRVCLAEGGDPGPGGRCVGAPGGCQGAEGAGVRSSSRRPVLFPASGPLPGVRSSSRRPVLFPASGPDEVGQMSPCGALVRSTTASTCPRASYPADPTLTTPRTGLERGARPGSKPPAIRVTLAGTTDDQELVRHLGVRAHLGRLRRPPRRASDAPGHRRG
jgi:hypothetical protein